MQLKIKRPKQWDKLKLKKKKGAQRQEQISEETRKSRKRKFAENLAEEI